MSESIWWETDERMTHNETAAFIGIKPCSLSSAISRGIYAFPRYRVGGKFYYRKSEIVEAIERSRSC